MSIEQQKKPPHNREPDALAITADYERPTVVRHTSARPKLLLLAGSDSSELQMLLRQRLRWIATAAGIVSALSAQPKVSLVGTMEFRPRGFAHRKLARSAYRGRLYLRLYGTRDLAVE